MDQDLVIVGAGPGGYVAALWAARAGLRTTLIERGRPGGTCLHVGCIPTKCLLHTAALLQRAQGGKRYGVSAAATLDLPAAQRHASRTIDKLTGGIESLLRDAGVTVLTGTAAPGPRVGEVVTTSATGGTTTVIGRHTILATGSEPATLPHLPIDGTRIITSNEALTLPSVPASLLIIGGGAIGVEFASIYAAFGSKVTLVELLPHLVPSGDAEIAGVLEKALARRRIKVLTGTTVEGAEVGPNGVQARLRTGDATQTLTVDVVLVATGRRPVTAGFAQAWGLRSVEGRAFVEVDARMRTSHEQVYAVGDLVATPQLAHVASAEAKVAVDAIAGAPVHPLDYDAVPLCIYSLPEVASVGLSEAAARRLPEIGADVRVGRFPFAAISKASVVGELDGLIKVIAEPGARGRVLGVHLVGELATELIADGLNWVGQPAVELERRVHAHPTLAEGLHEALLGVTAGGPLHLPRAP